MKRSRALVMIFAGFILSSCVPDKFSTQPEVKGLEGAAPVQTLVNPSDTTEVRLRVGGRLIVKLDANATTGYFWQIDPYNTQVVEQVSSEYTTDSHPPGMVGVGGVRVVEFLALSSGKTVVKFGYSRGGVPYDDVRKIVITVAG